MHDRYLAPKTPTLPYKYMYNVLQCLEICLLDGEVRTVLH